jgi:hypothetical protein
MPPGAQRLAVWSASRQRLVTVAFSGKFYCIKMMRAISVMWALFSGHRTACNCAWKTVYTTGYQCRRNGLHSKSCTISLAMRTIAFSISADAAAQKRDASHRGSTDIWWLQCQDTIPQSDLACGASVAEDGNHVCATLVGKGDSIAHSGFSHEPEIP